MRNNILTATTLVFIGLTVSIGCSSTEIITMPNYPSRYASYFLESCYLWRPWMPIIRYQEVDLSVLTWGEEPGPGETIGYPVQTVYDNENRHWTAAVTVEKYYGAYSMINFAWLDDVDNPDGGPPIAS